MDWQEIMKLAELIRKTPITGRPARVNTVKPVDEGKSAWQNSDFREIHEG